MITIGNPKYPICVTTINCPETENLCENWFFHTAICVCALPATRSLIYKGGAQNGGCTV